MIDWNIMNILLIILDIIALTMILLGLTYKNPFNIIIIFIIIVNFLYAIIDLIKIKKEGR
ncbi:MAG: hypothetical protein IKG40_01395 [Bacilli bacterium]|nr:hypothetical protein [Bacilli bacterium]